MFNLKRIRIFGNVLMLFGIAAFIIEFLYDQNYLALEHLLGGDFVCGFGGLAAVILGIGIAEWARIQLLPQPKPLPISFSKPKN